ncbi:ATPase P [Desulfurivibrio sp. D14AmB]|uniref:ATPase P n=1 Tax=Desulfurivibrio sp. D14AmB TaxID=3374370 RepID=UPI00376ECAC5
MAIIFAVPGGKNYQLDQIVFDLNGTIANGGRVASTTRELLTRLAQRATLYLITADTHHTASEIEEVLGEAVRWQLLSGSATAAAKQELVRQLGSGRTAAVGNGANDLLMLEEAALAIAVAGEEGCFAPLLSRADLLVTHIDQALMLLLEPKRIIATLRG